MAFEIRVKTVTGIICQFWQMTPVSFYIHVAIIDITIKSLTPRVTFL